jgi:glycine betaine catabolism A
MTSPAEASGQGAPQSKARSPEGSGSRTPEGAVYWDPSQLHVELEQLFYRHWLCVAREEQLPRPGDFITRKIGTESILFVREATGTVRGFYNLCRHRGTRVVIESEGKGKHSFVCPYHSWTYDLNGRLIGARHMEEQDDFDRADHGLVPVRVDTWGGFVWTCLDVDGPSLREELGTFFDRFARFPLADLRLGARKEYEVEANWKVLVENFSECYHCAPVHPNLNRLTPYLSGDNDASFHPKEGRSLFAGGYMTFAKDYQSMTRSGYTNRPLIPGITAEDQKRVYYYVVFPNMFFSLHPDYLMVHRCWPTSTSHSRVENEFYFPRETVEAPGFDPSDATDLWDEINRQDWAVCELAQEGTGSRAWTTGRYSDRESMVRDFDEFVFEELQRSSTRAKPAPQLGA